MVEVPANSVCPLSRSEWREWLKSHHDTSSGTWVIFFKKHTGQPTVRYDEAVEEALCFGWIDSQAKPIDADRSMQRFSPRRKGGTWSGLNKTRVAKLVKAGLMTPAGQARIDEAKQDGSWTFLDKIEALIVPPDLQMAFDKHPLAADNFGKFPPSVRRFSLFWVVSAKRPETRANRVAKIAELAAQNQRYE
jgi:uncharacterized protein YdeI (YjbR/CyaY-like superfamily)